MHARTQLINLPLKIKLRNFPSLNPSRVAYECQAVYNAPSLRNNHVLGHSIPIGPENRFSLIRPA